jgi:hypothetical protein
MITITTFLKNRKFKEYLKGEFEKEVNSFYKWFLAIFVIEFRLII